MAAMLMGTASARAQTQSGDPQTPDRPYRGLFAETRGASEQSLTFLGSVGAGYDTNVFAGLAGGIGGAPVTTGLAQASGFEDGSASLAYSVSHGRVSFSATGSTNATYYASLQQEPFVVSDAGGVSATLGLTSRTQVAGSVGASYQPFYGLPGAPLPLGDALDQSAQPIGQSLALDSGAVVDIEDHLSVSAGATLTHEVTRRLSLSASYGYFAVTSPSHDFDLSSTSESAGLGYLLAKGLSLQLGYTQSAGHYGFVTGPATINRGLTGGINFNRALSLSRRTHLTFSSGVSAITNTALQNDRAQYYVTGQVSLTREIGRTWNAALSYSRSAAFVETFLQPVLSDSLSASLGGLIGRRVQVQGSAGMTNGNIGVVTTASNHFRTYFGSAGLRWSLSRAIAIGTDYSYYWYHFADEVVLPAGFASRGDRQSIRVYLDLWAPLMNRGRRSNATR